MSHGHKDIFYAQSEQFGNPERQRQGRIVFFRLDALTSISDFIGIHSPFRKTAIYRANWPAPCRYPISETIFVFF